MTQVGFYLSISFAFTAIVLFIIAYGISCSVQRKKERCTEVVSGRVIGYGLPADEDSPVRLPIVEYCVDGTVYKKTGPRYAFKTLVVSSPFIKKTVCEYTTDIYSQAFSIKVRRNSFGFVMKNPMEEFFPIDTQVDVYYDPKKPKRAYVLRLLENKLAIKVLAIVGAAFAVTAFAFFFI